uniref:Uncharacterized protein n=1 Tax=Romanomermis culicivorax TaxID=13658 RepID=A0A915J594_ROMCU
MGNGGIQRTHAQLEPTHNIMQIRKTCTVVYDNHETGMLEMIYMLMTNHGRENPANPPIKNTISIMLNAHGASKLAHTKQFIFARPVMYALLVGLVLIYEHFIETAYSIHEHGLGYGGFLCGYS